MSPATPIPADPNVRSFPASRMGDAELVQMLRSGSDEAAAAIWDRYAGMVRRIVRRTLSPGADTEDLVQEVFLRFIDTVPTLRSPGSLKAFLYGIASRCAISELRRRRVRRMVGLTRSGVLPELATPEASHEAREALRALYRTLDRFPPRERVVFVLHDVENLEFTEVAAALRLSLSTVKRAAASARQRLAQAAEREPALHPYAHGTVRSALGGSP